MRWLYFSFVLFFFSLVSVYASEARNIVIKADKLYADVNKGLMRFEGGVNATGKDFSLICDLLIVETKSNRVSLVKAFGSVVVTTQQVRIFSKEAVYFSDKEKIVFTGNPRVLIRDNVIKGQKIIYFVKSGSITVEGGKRGVNAIISPEELEKK